jgi:hypothetical protein
MTAVPGRANTAGERFFPTAEGGREAQVREGIYNKKI